MIKRSLLLVVLVLTSIGINAQQFFQCYYDDVPESQMISPECSNVSNYTPDEFSETLWVKVNIHFIHHSDPLNPMNFTSTWDGVDEVNNYNGYQYAEDLINMSNYRLSENPQVNMPPGNSIPNLETKYRLKLMGVYFHEDDELYNSESLGDLKNAFGINLGEEINLFFTSQDLGGYIGGAAVISGQRCAIFKGPWDAYAMYDGMMWPVSNGVLHETAHNFTLRHTMRYGGGTCCNEVVGSSCDDYCADTPSRQEIVNNYGFDPCCGSFEEGEQCENNLMGYSGLTALTPNQLARIHHTLMLDMNNYLYKDDLCSHDSSSIIEISSDMTWNQSRYVRRDIHVQGNSTLTVKCDLFLASSTKIIVEPGSTLIVDGGRLTNDCGQLWKGVEVWGDSETDQPTPGIQGKIKLLNDAVIENAICGVRLGRKMAEDGYLIDWSKTGGYIDAKESVFRNNLKDVEFLSYHNINDNSGILYNNVSKFRDCKFIVDSELGELESGESPSSMLSRVSLFKVEGVSFSKCDFLIEDEALDIYSLQQRGVAIRSIEAGFSLKGECDNGFGFMECVEGDLTCQGLGVSDNYKHSTIEGFGVGIMAVAYNGGMPIKISKTLFDLNSISSRFIGTNHTSFSENKVLLNQYDEFNDSMLGEADCLGAQFVGCSEYTITRNVFDGGDLSSDVDVDIKVGLNIIESGELANEVYLNDFNGLHTGTLIQGQNSNNNSLSESSEGLQVLCNNYESSYFDIALTDEASVALFQGDFMVNVEDENLAPAGNVFSEYQGSNEGDVFVCDGCEILFYSHHEYGMQNEKVVPEDYDVNDVFALDQGVVYVDRESSCPVDRYYSSTKPALIEKVNEKRMVVANLESMLEQEIDGGDTQNVIEYVNNTINSDWDVRNYLLSYSPYLSDEVMISLLQREEPVNQWVLCEVLLANSPLNLKVLREYENNQFVDYLHNILYAHQNGVSSKSIKKAELIHFHSLEESLVRYFVQKSTFDNNDSLVSCSEIKDIYESSEVNAKIKSVFPLLVKEGKFIEAEALLEDYIPTCLNDKYFEYASLVLRYNAEELTSVDIQELKSIENANVNESIKAKVLSEVVTGEVGEYPILTLPSELNKRNSYSEIESSREKLFTISPNPSSGVFYVSYILPDNISKNSVVVVRNILGELVDQKNLSELAGISYFDFSSREKGVYVVSLEFNGDIVESRKIVIQ